MTLDDELVESVENMVKALKTTRSAFTRKALREAIAIFNLKQQEEKHRKGYELHPVAKDEFSVWENEQDWGNNCIELHNKLLYRKYMR